jgi:two-component system, OmpR family, sensor histidine kinase CssS
MKTLRQRISLPLILGALLVPLVIMAAFNIVMRLYMLNVARQDLQSTAAVLQALVRQQMAETGRENADSLNQALADRLNGLRTMLKAANRASDIDFLVASRSGRILFPVDTAALDLNTRLLNRIRLQLSQKLVSGEIQSLYAAASHFLYVGLPLGNLAANQPLWLICLIRYSPTRGFLLVTNLLMLGVLLLGALASILLTVRTARRISEPLLRLQQFADQVGRGNFLSAEPDSFCREISGLQQQMNQMARRLDQADNLQKTFLQNASHELRTPLMAIQGYAEGLQSGVLTDVPGAAGIIVNESHRLNRLVESLLTLSRIENQAGALRLLPLHLPGWLQDQIQRVAGISLHAGKSVRLALPAADVSAGSLTVMADEELLGQAVANVLSNAVRYAAKYIDVRLETEQNQARIIMEDDGPGIPPEYLPHLFERFFKGPGGQNGLGLAIAHSAVVALQGRLTADNRSSGGARFVIALPLARGSETPAAAAVHPAAAGGVGRTAPGESGT